MSIKVEDYFAPETFKRMKAFADQQETPFVVIDKQTIANSYDQLVNCFPFAKIYYAVKANPAPEVLSLLASLGSCFDTATVAAARNSHRLNVMHVCAVTSYSSSCGSATRTSVCTARRTWSRGSYGSSMVLRSAQPAASAAMVTSPDRAAPKCSSHSRTCSALACSVNGAV